MAAILRWRAEHEPARLAHVFLSESEGGEARLTYGELDAAARMIAAELATRCSPGDRALLLYPPGLDFVAAFFGCLYAGVVAVPAYPPRNPAHLPRLRALLQDAAATLALSNAKTVEAIIRQTAEQPEWNGLNLVATDTLDPARAAACHPVKVAANDLAFLQYTSGSTGAPKGVMVTHANIVYNTHYIQESFSLDRDSVSVSWLPAFHDMGLIDGVLRPVYTGHCGVLLSPVSFIQRPVRWLEAITRFGGTHGGGPNFGYDLCVEKIGPEARAGLDLSTWRSAYNGAEPVRAHTLRAFTAAFAACGFRPQAHYPCFGMAETTLMVSGGDIAEQAVVTPVDRTELEAGRFVAAAAGAAADTSLDLVSSGRMILDTKVAIVDPERGERTAAGVIGEVWVAGPTVAAGYWRKPEETAATFAARLPGEATEWLRTGDLGYLDEAGELFICGRTKDLIIIRGRNHYPQDLEFTAERAHPALKPGGGAAFAVEVDGQERLVMAQELLRTALRQADPEEIGAAIAQAVLEEHEVQPFAVVLLKTGTVPKTSSGKIQRQTARRQFLAGDLAAVGEWRPPAPSALSAERPKRELSAAPELMAWLRGRLARELGSTAEAIDVHAPFSAYGLDSATLVALSGELQDQLGRDVPPMLLYDYPDIARLAAHLTGEREAPRAAPDPADAGGDDGIAIIGLGLRFPGGAHDAASFWQLLREGADAISEVPPDRFDLNEVYAPEAATPGKTNSRHGGFLQGIDRFDAEFFGIAPREAAALDPQQRLLLEVAWHALENAGIAPTSLAGSETGVFVGISTQDYARRALPATELGRIDAYGGTGNALSAAAGRLAYVLGLEGPAVAIDTACSSSLVAVHQASQALRAGECRLAMAGGVNVILGPELAVNFSQARMLAPDGRCKAFAAGADGYVRSEGCGLVVLKRLAEARADGDPVLAVIRGSAVNQDGRSNGLTAPNGPAQVKVVRAALRRARLQPADIGYVEAHGTGTELGDPIEVKALAESIGSERGPAGPLLLGSVKSNLGHLEAAAGVASLIKTVLALRHGELPASLHCAALNPHLPWDELPLAVVRQHQAWPESAPRRAGVSSFGFAGTNAHVIVEAADPAPVPVAPASPGTLLALSARTAPALAELASAVAARLEAEPQLPLGDVAHTLHATRTSEPFRCAVAGADAAAIASRLRAAQTLARPPEPPRVAFLFTGQGSQYPGMGRTFYETEPVFRAAFDRCAKILDTMLPLPLGEVVFAAPDSEAAARLHETGFTQPALFALEWSLAELWRSWGLEPAVVTGHSVGEYIAAAVAGVFSVEDGLRLIAARGRLMQALPAGGGMLAAFTDEATAQAALRGYANVAVAAVNAPNEIVLAGPSGDLTAIGLAWAKQGIASQPLTVSHAFHSPLMKPMLAEFEAVLAGVTFASPRIPLVSNLGANANPATARHWRDHVLGTVRFADGVAAIARSEIDVLLEVGPKPVLTALASKSWSGDVRVVASLRPSRDEGDTLLAAAAELWVAGALLEPVHVSAPHGRRRADLDLPGYPFQRQRHWIEAAPRPARRPAQARVNPTLGAWTAPASAQEMAFGIMFFNGQEAVGDRDKYRLVLEAARYADEHGFSSVWVPERHYTKFGGLYPNPTVLAAALARETRSLRLMAGSLVAPLHHPLRVAEDWSVIDNLSGGRVGISFAPGWNPGDFAMAPAAYAGRRDAVTQAITQVRSLWRGETVTSSLPDGETADVRIYPTPLQPELPVWLTAAGNPESFERAGALGANLLTHLLDQEPAQLAEKIARYRAARAEAGHDPASGRVTVMLHAFSGPDDATIKARIRPPYIEFLKENLHLLRGLAVSRGRDLDPAQLSEADKEDFAGMLFDRFYARRALFGTVDACAELVRRLGEAGVNEIACLLDFGASTTDVQESLPYLNALRAQFAATTEPVGDVTGMLPEGRPPATKMSEVLHRVTWHETPGPAALPQEMAGRWIVLAAGDGSAEAVAERLVSLGGDVTVVEPGVAFAEPSPGRYQVDPADPNGFDRVVAVGEGPIRGVVHAWCLGLSAGDDLTEEAMAAGQRLGPMGMLHLVQALERSGRVAPIWLVTRGGEGPVGGDDAVVGSPAQAPVRGLTRVLAIEHAELWGGVIDLPVTAGPEDAARVVQSLADPSGEDVVAWRQGKRWIARLEAEAPAGLLPLEMRPDRTYLVTGGLGAMGRALLRWLVARGGRHLVVTGRQSGDELDAAKRTVLAELEAAGATVTYAAADAADETAMGGLCDRIAASGAPLAGVLHLAGRAEDRPIREADFARDAPVHDAKLRGAWILHERTKELPLDWFVAFSSITVVWGTTGLPLYAAASQFLDALGDYRRARGLPATIINFGPWSEGGMVAGETRARLARVGVHTMTPEAGVAVVEQAIVAGRTRQVAAAIDRERLRDLFAVRGRRSLFSEAVATVVTPSMAETALRRELDALGAPARIGRLIGWLQDAVAATLRLPAGQPPAPTRGFFEMGMDSLMAIEIKNRLQTELGVPLRATVVFNYPNIAQLADYLAALLPGEDAKATGAAADDLDALSTDELAALLENELEAIDGATEGRAP